MGQALLRLLFLGDPGNPLDHLALGRPSQFHFPNEAQRSSSTFSNDSEPVDG